MPAPVLALASSLAKDGEPGTFYLVGREKGKTLAGPKLSALSSLSILFASTYLNHISIMSRSSVTTKELLKDGGKATAATHPQTKSFVEYISSENCKGTPSTHAMSPAAKIQQTTLPVASTLPMPYYSLPFQSWKSSAASSSTSMQDSSLLSSTLVKLDVYGIISQSPHKIGSPTPTTLSAQFLKAARSSHTSETTFQARLQPSASIPPFQTVHTKPAPYPARLTPKPSEYHPHCAAKNCLHLWRPTCSRQAGMMLASQ